MHIIMNNQIVISSLFVLVYTVSCTTTFGSDWKIITDENGKFEMIDLNFKPEDSYSTLADLREDVIFYLFTPSNPEDGERIYLEEILSDTRLNETNFNASYPTRILIHGWRNSVTWPFNILIRDAYLGAGPYNIFVVDWSKYALQEYIYARSKIVTVGKYVALLIDCLVINGVDPNDLIVIGHSLGAHLSGVACRSSQHDVGILIGLDPAGPLFYLVNLYARLRKTDALFTQVAHTNAGTLGHLWNLGHVDIWMNGGSIQPGCDPAVPTCSHSRAYFYYAESVQYNEIKYSTEYFQYQLGSCASHQPSYFGGIDIDTTACGIHYVETNPTSIYAKG